MSSLMNSPAPLTPPLLRDQRCPACETLLGRSARARLFLDRVILAHATDGFCGQCYTAITWIPHEGIALRDAPSLTLPASWTSADVSCIHCRSVLGTRVASLGMRADTVHIVGRVHLTCRACDHDRRWQAPLSQMSRQEAQEL